LALLLTNALIACGGGGGSGGSTSGANTSSNIIQAATFLGTKTSAGSFTYYRDGSIVIQSVTSTPRILTMMVLMKFFSLHLKHNQIHRPTIAILQYIFLVGKTMCSKK